MSKRHNPDPLAERPNLDYSKGVRGKYAGTPKNFTGRNIVLLDDDLSKSFPDSTSVNRALRALLAIKEQAKSVPVRTSRKSRAA